jgi:hypothetical protein
LASGPVDWGVAQRVAVRVAGKEPLAASYHSDRLAPDFAELTTGAAELVAQATGLRSAGGPARAGVVGRDGWVTANLASFDRLLRPFTDKLAVRLDQRRGWRALPTGGTRRAAGVEVGALIWLCPTWAGRQACCSTDEPREALAQRRWVPASCQGSD